MKMQGTGNDFVVLDSIANPLPQHLDVATAALQLCHRRYGVGSDGVLLLCPASEPGLGQVRMRMWNPDGTEDMCGNGLRCITRLAWDRGYSPLRRFAVQTLAGTRKVEAAVGGNISVEMGQPVLATTSIPIDLRETGSDTPLEYSLSVGGVQLNCSTLSTGSTHTIIWLEEPLSDDKFQTISPQLEVHAAYPQRSSIIWANVTDRDAIAIRVWERGAGETLACGTGACAAAVAGQLTDRCGSDVRVESRGGSLQVHWENGGEILMTGDARVSFSGEIPIALGRAKGR